MRAPTEDAVFSALADPTRRQILRHLSEAGSLSATEMTGLYPMSRQAVVKHLLALTQAGLVEGHRQGREVLYSAVPAGLAPVGSWVSEVEAVWDRRLQRLHRRLSAERPVVNTDLRGSR